MNRLRIIPCLVVLILSFELSAQNFTMTLIPIPETCTGNGQIDVKISNAVPGNSFGMSIYRLPDETYPYRDIYHTNPLYSTFTYSFDVLPSGKYKIVVQDATLGTWQTDTVTVPNAVKPLAFMFEQIICGGVTSIRVNVTAGNPATYALLNTNQTVAIPPQTSNLLENIAAGDYIIAVTDTCGNTLTQGITVTSAPSYKNYQYFSHLVDCGHYQYYDYLGYSDQTKLPAEAYPITVTYYDDHADPSSGVFTEFGQVVWNTPADNYTDHATVRVPYYPGVAYTMRTIYTTACGGNYTYDLPRNQEFWYGSRQMGAICGAQYLRTFWMENYMPPLTMTFTGYPDGFQPWNHSSAFTAGSYAGLYTQDIGSIQDYGGWDFGSVSNPLPDGKYYFTVTDACGQERNDSITIQHEIPQLVGWRNDPDCNGDHAQFGLWLANNMNMTDSITQVWITAAPQAFLDEFGITAADLPYDASAGIIKADASFPQYTLMKGEFLMTLPSGAYSFKVYGKCTATPYTGDFYVNYNTLLEEQVTPSYNCGSFNVSVLITKTYAWGSAALYLQRYYPEYNLWGAPVYINSGSLQNNGDGIWGDTKYASYGNAQQFNMINTLWITENVINGGYIGQYQYTGAMTNLTTGPGLYRVVYPGTDYENYSEAALLYCYKVLKEFTIPKNGIMLNNFYIAPCHDGTYELLIDAVGSGELTYKIVKKDDQNVSIDNGNVPIFSNLSTGTYTVQVSDSKCGTSDMFIFKVSQPKMPAIKPVNLCDGEIGSLTVDLPSFLTIKWTKDDNPTVLGTGNQLVLDPFTFAQNSGTYYAHFTYAPNHIFCINSVSSILDVNEGAMAPNAGTGQQVTLYIPNLPNLINLFDYLTPPYNEWGVWSDPQNTGRLNGYFLNTAQLPTGTYTFIYTVAGQCSDSDATSLTLELKEQKFVPMINPQLRARVY